MCSTLWQRMSEQLLDSSEVSKAAVVDHFDKAKRPFKKGSQLSAYSPYSFASKDVYLTGLIVLCHCQSSMMYLHHCMFIKFPFGQWAWCVLITFLCI